MIIHGLGTKGWITDIQEIERPIYQHFCMIKQFIFQIPHPMDWKTDQV